MSELALAMKALGFSSASVKEAMEQGDRDGDGELNFEEFVALLARAGGGGGGGLGGGLGSDAFPFALIANSYRISKLVDSHNPALAMGGTQPPSKPSALPPIAYARAHKLTKERTRGDLGLGRPGGKSKAAPGRQRQSSSLPPVDLRRGRKPFG